MNGQGGKGGTMVPLAAEELRKRFSPTGVMVKENAPRKNCYKRNSTLQVGKQ